MPRELVAVEPRKPVLREYDDGPVPGGHVRVAVEYGSPKRGTELSNYRVDRASSFPQALGNMCVGRVTEVGAGVEGVSVGDRVAGHGHLRETHTWRAGGVLHMPDRMSWKEAVCYDPAHFGLSAVRDGQVRLGDRVAVFGLGAIGQMTVQMAAHAGASVVIALDPIEKRRRAAQNAGVDLAVDPVNEDAQAIAQDVTGGLGFDVAVETSGSYEALDQAIRVLAYGGTVVVAGWMKECKGGLDLGAVAHTEVPSFVFARACSEPNRDHPRWDFGRITRHCWGWLAEGRYQCEEIVDPVVPFEDSAAAYEEMDYHPERSVKLGVSFK